MKKDNNILYFGLFFAASVLAEVFCIVEDINIIGISIVVWIATYLVIDAYRCDKAKYYKYMENFFTERLNELEKVEKALYVQMKKNAEITEEKLQQIAEERKAGYEELINSQNQSTKIIVKYVREDIKKSSAIDKANCEKISASIHQGVNKIIAQKQSDVFDTKEITGSLDSNFDKLIDRMESRMKDIEKECVKLEQISDNLRLDIKGIQLNSQPVLVPTRDQNVLLNQKKTDSLNEAAATDEIIAEIKDDQAYEQKVEEPKIQTADAEVQKEETKKDIVPEPRVETSKAEEIKPIVTEEEKPEIGLIKEESDVAITNKQAGMDANKQLNADEIAALFAAAEEESKDSTVEVEEESSKEDSTDPNRQLSADEIAAMFAAAGDKDKEVNNKENEKPQVDVDASDPNKQLSADDIAALFASMG